MRNSIVLENASRGTPSWGMALHLTDPSIYELASLSGVDCIWMDLEHHGYSVETASGLMRAARVGKSDIVARPAKGEFMRMARLLEMGANGIMYPRCDGPEEAAEVVRWAKFAPLGERGIDAANPDNPYCATPIKEYLREANEKTFLIVQVEQQHSVDQAEAILAVEGVGFLMLGPADFSILSGLAGDVEHPRVQAAIDTVAQAAANTGKHWAATAATPDRAAALIAAGCDLVFHQADILLVKNGIEATRRELASRDIVLRPSQLSGQRGAS